MKMESGIYSIIILLFSTSLLISGSGLMNTIISLKLKISGKSELLIGVVAGMYFFGMLLGSIKTIQLMKKVGYVKSFLAMSIMMALSTIIPSINNNIIIFLISRLIQGGSMAGLYIIIDSWILCSSKKQERGKNLALYMITLYTSYAVSQFFLLSNYTNNVLPFYISSILIILSTVPMLTTEIESPKNEEQKNVCLKTIYKNSKIGFIGCFVSGMIISSIFTILPIYIESIESSTDLISLALASSFISGVIIQYPIGKVSDKYEKKIITIILNIIYNIILIIFSVLEYYNKVNYLKLIILVNAIGAFSFAIYPISINIVCENLKDSEITSGAQGATISYGVGSVIGPIYSSYCIKIFGLCGYTLSYSVLLSLMTVFIIFRKN